MGLTNPFELLEAKLLAIEQSNQQILTLLTSQRHADNSKPEAYQTRQEVAQQLRITLPTLNKITKAEKIQSCKIGRRVLYKPTEVVAALTSIKTKGGN